MPLAIIRLKPGVNIEASQTLNSESWSASNLIRFFQGLPQKIGGWLHLNATPLTGTGRGMHAWADLGGNPYVAVGTEQRLELFNQGQIQDITPLRKTTNPAVNFSTVNTSKTVTILDTGHGGSTGDWLNIPVPVSIGGIVLQGFYILTVTGANSYTIQAARAATATVNNAGAVPSFNVAGAGLSLITVTLNDHGLANGALFAVQILTTVGGIAVAVGSYAVSSVAANTFQIAPGGVSTGAATVAENAGNVQLQYLLPTGLASAAVLTGYGQGPYGGGPYGVGGGGQLIAPLRQWFLSNWGQQLLAQYSGGPFYLWTPPLATPALRIDTTNNPGALQPPTLVQSSFVAAAQQIAVALGVDAFGTGVLDPNLIRWCDAADNTDWQASATNQAGSYRIPTGSRIVGGVYAGQFAFLWTDIDMWSMQYVGLPFVFAFQKIANSTDLLSARCVGVFEAIPYWVSANNFHTYDGAQVQVIPCTVWDFFFNNLDRLQKDKVFAAVDSWFGEVFWFFPSLSGGGEVDSYVKLNVKEGGVWDYGTLARTCWVDDNVLGAPIGVDTAGLLQQHETGYDADGQAMMPSITSGYFSLADGTIFTFIERLIADFVLNGGTAPTNRVFISILVADYPTDAPIIYGPYPFNGTLPPYSIVRARGRVAAIRIASSDLGIFWRLGALRISHAPAGRR